MLLRRREPTLCPAHQPPHHYKVSVDEFATKLYAKLGFLVRMLEIRRKDTATLPTSGRRGTRLPR